MSAHATRDLGLADVLSPCSFRHPHRLIRSLEKRCCMNSSSFSAHAATVAVSPARTRRDNIIARRAKRWQHTSRRSCGPVPLKQPEWPRWSTRTHTCFGACNSTQRHASCPRACGLQLRIKRFLWVLILTYTLENKMNYMIVNESLWSSLTHAYLHNISMVCQRNVAKLSSTLQEPQHNFT